MQKLTMLLAVAACLLLAGPARAEQPPSSSVQPSAAATPAALPANARFLPQPPKHLTLCGEKVPLDDPFIAEQLDREFQGMVHDQAQMVMCLKRAGRYFPYITKELRAAGLPDDLKYLAVTESYLLYYVRSKAGALGLWQFMPATGKQFSLRVDDIIDERLNPEKATQAAIAYFKNLYRMFGNWALVMAAYNCGEGKIAAEMKEQGSRDYYELYLPRETMRYVFRIMAVKVILSNPETYGYYLPAEQVYKPLAGDSVTLTLEQTTPLRELADAGKTSVRRLRELNPQINSGSLPKGSYQLLMPSGQGASALKQLQRGQAPATPAAPTIGPTPTDNSPTLSQHRIWQVRPGDTLNSVARRFGVSAQAIQRANKLGDRNIRIGQKLLIPDAGE